MIKRSLFVVATLAGACNSPPSEVDLSPDAAETEGEETHPEGEVRAFSSSQKLLPTAVGGFQVGHSIAIDGDTLITGALIDNQVASGAGAAYIFARSGGTFALQQKIVGSDITLGQRFGKTVAISGDTAIVGAAGEAGNPQLGAAYVFVRSGTTWSQQQKIVAPDGQAADRFGQTARLEGNIAIIGAPNDDDLGADSGSAYVFVRSGTTWSLQQKIKAPDGATGDQFGYRVDISGTTVIVGARRDDDLGSESGSVYVFVESAGVWSFQQKLTAPDGAVNHRFAQVSLSGDTAMIGAWGHNNFAGSTYVFVRSGTTWSLQQQLTASGTSAGDQTGQSVMVKGNIAVVSALRDDVGGNNTGSAYIFKRTGTTWTEDQRLNAFDAAADDEFGKSVALSGNTVVIGSHLDDNAQGANAGAVYTFTQPPSVINGGDFGGADLIPNNGDILNGTFTNVGTFHVPAGVTAFVAPGVALDVSATTTIIDGTLDANGAGSAGGAAVAAGPVFGNDGLGLGRGGRGRPGPCAHGGGGGGAGYGGPGGTGGYAFNEAGYPNGGVIYGSDTGVFIEQGSGGGGGGSSCADTGGAGGTGGGSIRIQSTSIAVNGLVRANGLPGALGLVNGGAGGGGSGGGIALLSNTLTGTGSVTADAGNGGSEQNADFESDGGGGGGGKIKVFSTPPFSTSVAPGSAGGPCTGGSAFCPAAGAVGKLIILAPTLTAIPSSVPFGNVVVGGSSSPQNVILRNTGGPDVTITQISTAAPFSVGNLPALPLTLTSNAEVTITTTFSPTTTGLANGSITVTSNDPASPTNIALSGTGTQPAIDIQPGSNDFGDQRVGTTSAGKTFAIKNTGTATLNVTAITTTGPFATPNTSFALAPNATQNISVTFSPTATGAANGSFVVTHNAPGSPTSISLTGNGTASVIDIQPGSNDFGDQRVGTTSVGKTFAIKNTGTASLNVTAITTTGPFATPNTSFSVAPGATQNISVTFSPTATGPANGSFTVTHDAAGSPTSISLTGNGVAPAIDIQPGSNNFGDQRVGTTSVGKIFAIKNTGTASLNVTAITTTGPFATPNTSFSVAPGATQNISVTFSPTATGTANGSFTVAHDATGSPTSISLTGNGIAPAIDVQPGSNDFGDQRVGTTSAGKTFAIKNTGTASLNVSAITTTGPFSTPNTSFSLAPNATQNISVTFSPTATGTANGSFVVTHDATGSPTSISLTGNGTAPAIDIQPGSNDFGDQRVGTTSAGKTFAIKNTGTATLNVSAITTTGPFATPNTSFSLAPNATQNISVTFSPTATGTANGSFTVAHDATGSPTSISLTGNGTAPAIDIQPGSNDFGDQRVGTTSAGKTFEIKNTGTATLNVTAITTTGPFATPNTSFSVAPGATQNISVTFSPTVTGPANGSFTVTHDATGSPTSISLTGNGIAPAIDIQPGSNDFGDQRVGTTSVGKTFAIKNTGTASLNVSAITTTGPFATPNTSFSVAPGATQNISVTFSPTVTGPANGSFTITHDATGSPTSISLTGNGTQSVIEIDPGSDDFGDQRVGTTSAGRTFAIKNTGTASLNVSAITTTGPFSTPNTSFSVAPGGSQNISVTFTPTATGAANGNFVVTHDAPGGPTTVNLSGNGIQSVISVPSSLAFGNQRVGTTSNGTTLTITNTGTADLNITNVVTSGPFASDFTTPFSISPNSSADLSITFSPTAVGAVNGDIQLTHDAPGSPSTVTLSGTGIEPVIEVDPTSIAFANQRVGTTSNPGRTLTIRNTGSEALSISAIATTGVFAAPPDPIVIQPDTSTNITVTFSPLIAGNAVGTLTITSDAANNTSLEVPLSGTGVEPLVSLTGTPVSFGFRRVGITGASRFVTVENTGTSNLQINSVTIPAPFAIVAPSSALTLTPSQSTVIEITFTPAAEGLVQQTLTIDTDAAANPTTFVVSGTGTVPGLTPSTTTLAFGTVKTGTTSPAQSFTLTNTGDATSTITAIAVPAGFSVEGPVPTSLLPDGQVTYSVTFNPAANGIASGNITFTSDAPQTPTIVLNGTGGSPMVSSTPTTVSFGAVAVGTTSDMQVITLQNTTDLPLDISDIVVAAPFVRTSIVLPTTVPANGQLTFGVLFSPTEGGPQAGALMVNSDGGSLAIPLDGEGLDPTSPPDPGGCCSTGGGNTSTSVLLGLAVLGVLRRRRRT